MWSSLTCWGALAIVVLAAMGFAAFVPPAGATIDQPPNDPAFPLQWNLQMIGAPAAWRVSTGANETIAIVDSGADLGHEDLRSQIVDSVNCIGHPCQAGNGVAQDNNGHGTHVAGIAAAATDNQTGVAGVAPDARLLIVKALDQSCDVTGSCSASGTAADVAAAIHYAADHGAAAINLSLGSESQSIVGPAFQDALDYAWSKGSIPVLAAGNDFLLPSGSAAHAIVVGALDRDGSRSAYSNIGTAAWSISAPGGSVNGDTTQSCSQAPQTVLSTYPGGYACLAGTSMAAPHVSGAVAILRSLGLSPQETVDRLLSSARPAGPGTGAGALDLAAAVGAAPTAAPDTGGAPPPADPGPPSAPAPTTTSAVASTAASTSSDSSTTAAPVIALPNQRTANAPSGRVTVRRPENDDVPAGPVVVAVLMASAVGLASGWMLLRRTGLTRRTA